MQNRVGPNKAGPFGILQTLADGIKLFFKEDLLPERADKWVFRLAPLLAVVPAFLVWSVIPLGGDFRDGNDGLVTWFGHETRVQLADPPIGILFVLALSSIAVYGIMLAGWSSGSKYPLLGAVRATAQMISYEAALGLSLAAVLLFAGTLSTSGIVAVQERARRLAHRGDRLRAVLRLRDRRHRRAQPSTVRPRRGRAGARRRVQHRVLEHPVRAVLPGRVHEHDHDERHHRDVVPRRAAADQDRRHHARHPADRERVGGNRVVPAQGAAVPLHVRLVPRHVAEAAVRPADGLRVEGADPDRPGLVRRARRDQPRPRS